MCRNSHQNLFSIKETWIYIVSSNCVNVVYDFILTIVNDSCLHINSVDVRNVGLCRFVVVVTFIMHTIIIIYTILRVR